MKRIIRIITFAFGLLVSQLIQAQGTVYLSSLSQDSTGNLLVGGDSWMAAQFYTGNNADGYMLNSVQLGMADASGSPNSFTVMVYSSIVGGAVLPGSNLDTLNGSDNPSTTSIYTFSPSSSLALSPSTFYYIVLTAGTTIANGAYQWSESAYPPSINNWGAGNGVLQSSNGTSGWSTTPYLGIAQFAITASTIPEPSVLALLSLSGLFFLRYRRRF